MNALRKLQLFALLAFGSALMSHGHAAVLVNDTKLVSASAELASAAKSGTFTIATAGAFRLTISDHVVTTPSNLTSASTVITQGTAVIARLDQTGASQSTSVDFNAQPGDYVINTIGKATDVASADVNVISVNGGTLVYSDSVTILAPTPPPSGVTDLATSLHVFAAGTYTLTFKDQTFPTALQDYDLILVDRSNATNSWRLCKLTCPTPGTTFQFTASVGDYDLLVTAYTSGSNQAGLFSITVDGGPQPVSNPAATYAAGKMPAPTLISLPAGGADLLTVSDLNFPAALSGVWVALVQGDRLLGQVSAVGSTPVSNAQQGNALLYSIATATDVATYARQIGKTGQTIYGDVRSTASTSYSFAGTGVAATTYTAQLKDFGFPSSLTSLQAVISQNGTVRTTMTASGSTDVQLSAGSVDLLVIPKATANANSLFGVSVATKGSGAKLLEVTQGVGDLFAARTFTVTDAGSYDVSLADLKFPAAFSELAVAVTRGPTLVGQIFGGGKFSFNATPGDYTLSFVAKAGGTSADYGLYNATVATTPPAPTVTLTASPTSVSAQGTTALTWSTTNADTCTASGAWSGTKLTGGSETSTALSVDSTFTLTCSGPGGSGTTSTKVTIATKSGGGGGGSLTIDLLAILVGLAVARSRMRCAG